MIYAAEGNSCDNDSSGSDTDSVGDEKNCLPLFFMLETLEKHVEGHIVFEETSIEFVYCMVIDDFNESQCLSHFWFKKRSPEGG